MSTCNFITTPGYPLYAISDDNFTDENGDFDELLAEDWYDDAKQIFDPFHETLRFHNVSIASGYYGDYQILITFKHFREDLEDNDYCRWFFDMPRSKALRAFDAEKRKIERWLDKNAANMGFEHIAPIARFSNGEVWYGKAA